MKKTMVATASLFALSLVLTSGCAVPAPDPVQTETIEELRELASWDFGQSRLPLIEFEARLRAADETGRVHLENELVWILEYEGASFAGRQFACRMLRRIGSERCLPALEPLLRDPELSHPARFALQGIESPQVDALLRRALAELDGELRAGVIDSIAARGDRAAVPQLAELLVDGDRETLRLCLSALGRIGGQDAARAILATDLDEILPVERNEALLRCADSMSAAGEETEAVALYVMLSGPDRSPPVRIAAWRGYLGTAPKNAAEVLLEILSDPQPQLREAGVRMLTELPADIDTGPLANELWTVGSDTRALALVALALRGDASTVPAALRALDDEDPRVRLAGIEALALVGNATHLEALAAFASRSAEEVRAAREAISNLNDPALDPALLALLPRADDATRAALIPCLAARQVSGAVPVLLDLYAAGDADVRAAALDGLYELAADGDLPALLALLASAGSEEQRARLGDVLLAICRRSQDRERAVGALIAAIGDQPGPGRAQLARILGEFPDDATLAALTEATAEVDDAVRISALRALSNWPDAAPLRTLLAACETATREEERAVVFAGSLRLVGLSDELELVEVLRAHEALYAAAGTLEERIIVIESAREAPDSWAIGFLAPLAGYDPEALPPGEIPEAPPELDAAEEAFGALCARLARSYPGVAIGCGVELGHDPDESYFEEGGATLTDGAWGSTAHTEGAWLGFQGVDLVAVVDLGEEVLVEDLRLGYLDNQKSWIFAPRAVRFELSLDGESWSAPEPRHSIWRAGPREEIEVPETGEIAPTTIGTMGFLLAEPTPARYLRVHAENVGILPDWHPGSGEEAWLFVDEIQVNPAY